MFILLSHFLGVDTPAFAGGPSLTISPIKEIGKGGSSNSYTLTFPNHLGTHIDAPLHFDPLGKPLSAYDLEDLVFTRPVLLDIPKEDSELIRRDDLQAEREPISKADLLLLRTGFERFRETDPVRYSTRNPGLSAEAAAYICQKLPGLRGIVLDTISASAVQHREEGGRAHTTLLSSRNFFIIEDAALSRYPGGVERILAFPLFVVGVDSAPCTLVAEAHSSRLAGRIQRR